MRDLPKTLEKGKLKLTKTHCPIKYTPINQQSTCWFCSVEILYVDGFLEWISEHTSLVRRKTQMTNEEVFDGESSPKKAKLSGKKLLVARASLLVTRALLLVARSYLVGGHRSNVTTSSKKLLVTFRISACRRRPR